MSCLNSGRSRSASTRREPDRVEVPEQPVVDEHELRVLLDRALEQRALGGDAGDDALDLAPARDLEPVRAQVVERAGVQQLVEARDQLGDVSHRSSSCVWNRGIGQMNVMFAVPDGRAGR